MVPTELERAVDRALRSLPGPAAPPTLLPRVMAAARRKEAARARSWFGWPVAWQVASAAAMVLLLVGIGWLLPGLRTAAAGSVSLVVSDLPQRLLAFAQDAGHAVDVMTVMWRGLLEPVLKAMFVVVIVMGVACAAFGTALSVALGGASQ
jgi:hypothetical protein